MPKFKENYCLKQYNTFGIDTKARYFVAFDSTSELKDILDSKDMIDANYDIKWLENIFLKK